MLPYGGRASGWPFCPFCRGVVSSEAESIRSLEGWFATLEQGGDAGCRRGSRRGTLERGEVLPRGLEGVWMGRTVLSGRGLGFFESFPFFWIGDCRTLWARRLGVCFVF